MKTPQKLPIYLNLPNAIMQAHISSNPQQALIPLLPKLSLPHLHQLHSHLYKSGLLHSNPFLSVKILSAAALLSPSYAASLLSLVSPPSLFAFNSLLRGLSLSSPPDLTTTFSLLNSLRPLGITPDPFSFIASLKSCARARALCLGRSLHGSAVKYRRSFDLVNVRNSLIYFYCACGDVENDARRVFDEMGHLRDVVSFSTLMNGYVQIGKGTEVVGLFRGMRECGFRINAASVVSLLSALGEEEGEGGADSIHGYCVKSGLCLDLNVRTATTGMYMKFGCLDHARSVFDEMGRRDVVLYNCIVDGYAKAGHLEKCMWLLRQMKGEGLRINSLTLVGLLSSCASSGALMVGRRVCEIAKAENLELDGSLGTAVLDMYMKCGCIDEAVEVFNHMRSRDVMAWTAMITGLGIHGRAREALRMFGEMEGEGVRPNDVTFLGVLNACSHGGMVDKAKDFCKKMVVEYGMSLNVKHYGCIVDLLGRLGLLDEAHELIRSLPLERDAKAWRSLLAACRVHGDIRLGKLAREALVALGDEHPTDSILLTGAYALLGKWAEVRIMRDLEQKGVKMVDKKEPGYSLIEMSR